jgi:hypothetical protein
MCSYEQGFETSDSIKDEGPLEKANDDRITFTRRTLHDCIKY